MNKEIQISELQKCNLQIYTNTSYINTEIQNTNLKKYNLQKCSNMNDMTTETQGTLNYRGAGPSKNYRNTKH